MTTTDTTGVLIVGAGPVGLTLGIELARRGVPFRIIDKRADPNLESRAIIVHSRTLDHFSTLGVLDRILERSIRSTGMEMHSDGKTLAAIDFGHIPATRPFSVSLPQSDTEAVLTERLTQFGVAIERGVAFVGFEQEGAGDEIRITVTSADGSIETVRARFLVGADGAASAVRHAAGESLAGSFAGDDVVLGDIEGEHSYDPAHFHGFFSPGDTTGLIFPLAGHRLRAFAQLPEGIDPKREVTIEWLQELLTERGIDVKVTAAHWLSRFILKHGLVERYRVGRVFLAGDAAHIHSPAGGLGMNTGIQDAVNLGWKLALGLDPQSGSAVLDSYHDERRAVAAGVVGLTTAMTRIGTISNPIGQRMRNALIHLGVQAEPVREAMADRIEQQDVRYRASGIVGGSGRELHPGDYLYLPDTDLGAELGGSPRHHLIAIAEHGDEAETGDLGSGLVPLSISAVDRMALRTATGSRGAVAVIVRPDGYVGYIGPDVSRARADYARLLAR